MATQERAGGLAPIAAACTRKEGFGEGQPTCFCDARMTLELFTRAPQNVIPSCTWYVRGATKCVPLNVDRKLNSASLFVRFKTLTRILSFTLSVRSALSTPAPTSNT